MNKFLNGCLRGFQVFCCMGLVLTGMFLPVFVIAKTHSILLAAFAFLLVCVIGGGILNAID